MICIEGYLEMPNTTLYTSLEAFNRLYENVHILLALTLCAICITGNSLNTIILTRRKIRSAINVILSSIAICDVIVATFYTVFIVEFRVIPQSCSQELLSYGWAWFLVLHNHVSSVFHAASLWLTVYSAVLRCVTLRKLSSGTYKALSKWVPTRTVQVCSIITLIVTLSHLPSMLIFTVKPLPHLMPISALCGSESNETAYMPDYSDLALQSDCVLLNMVPWSVGVLCKILPSLVLAGRLYLLDRCDAFEFEY